MRVQLANTWLWLCIISTVTYEHRSMGAVERVGLMSEECIYVIDIGDCFMRGGVHLDGMTTLFHTIETPRASRRQSGEEALLSAVASMIERLATQAPPMTALGVSASGMMTLRPRPGARGYGPFQDSELYVMAPNVDGLKYTPLMAKLEHLVDGIPVHVENDVNAVLESAAGHDNAICVNLGAGLGAAAKRNGRVLHPDGTWSCYEVGHGMRWTLADEFFRKCHCGNNGCLEAAIGGWAMSERYKVSPEKAKPEVYESMRADALALLPPAIAHLVDRTGIGRVLLTGMGSVGYFHGPEHRGHLLEATKRLTNKSVDVQLELVDFGATAELHGVALALQRHCGKAEEATA